MIANERAPEPEAIQRAVRIIRDNGLPTGVFICQGAGMKDSLRLLLSKTPEFENALGKPYYIFIGVYEAPVHRSDLSIDIEAAYGEETVS